MDFEVIADDLDVAAERLGEAVTAVTETRYSGTVRQIATALPGSSSAAAAQRCANALGTARTQWKSSADEHRNAMVDSAAAYRAADEATVLALGGLG